MLVKPVHLRFNENRFRSSRADNRRAKNTTKLTVDYFIMKDTLHDALHAFQVTDKNGCKSVADRFTAKFNVHYIDNIQFSHFFRFSRKLGGNECEELLCYAYIS
jgi:hypothetical protein